MHAAAPLAQWLRLAMLKAVFAAKAKEPTSPKTPVEPLPELPAGGWTRAEVRPLGF